MRQRLDEPDQKTIPDDNSRRSRTVAASAKHHARGLIRVAQIDRDAAEKIKIEKSLLELSLQINRTQQAERLQIGMRLQLILTRSLALEKIYPDALLVYGAEAEAEADAASRKNPPVIAGAEAKHPSDFNRRHLPQSDPGRAQESASGGTQRTA
jgi:hypothetical protein